MLLREKKYNYTIFCSQLSKENLLIELSISDVHFAAVILKLWTELQNPLLLVSVWLLDMWILFVTVNTVLSDFKKNIHKAMNACKTIQAYFKCHSSYFD